MIESIELPEPKGRKPIPEWAIAGTKDSRRNVITSIYLGHDELEAVNIKLQEKYAEIEKKEALFETYKTDDAELVLTGYGIISRLLHSAVDILRKEGYKVGMIRPITLFPFPKTKLRELALTTDSFLCVEMSNGQMVDDVKLAIECSKPVHLYTRMGGNVPSMEEITNKCREILA
jgi:pyruvate/2-oxoacid:ferredoxin oxidoreductase alpha subunit